MIAALLAAAALSPCVPGTATLNGVTSPIEACPTTISMGGDAGAVFTDTVNAYLQVGRAQRLGVYDDQ